MKTIWCSKRDFLDLLSRPRELDIFRREIELSTKPISAVQLHWNTSNEGYSDFPVLAVVDDLEYEPLLIATAALNSGISPLTSLCRVVRKSVAESYFDAAPLQGVSVALQALIGLSFVEAILHSSGQLQSRSLSPSICNRTLSIAWAKALQNAPISQLPFLTQNWIQGYSIASGNDGVEAVKSTLDAVRPMLAIAAELYHGIVPSSKFGLVCQGLVTATPNSAAEAWSYSTAAFPERFSQEEFENLTREERAAYFHYVADYFYKNRFTDDDPAKLAYIAMQIAPGTLEHLDLLLEGNDSRVALWYSFMQSLRFPNKVLTLNGGLGRRIARDVWQQRTFVDGPVVDCSIDELKILARSNIDFLGRKIAHANELEIELLPMVSGNFRYNSRNLRQQESIKFDGPPDAEINRHRTVHEQISDLRNALSKLGDSIDKELHPAKLPVKRARKKVQ
ncbi:MAG: hypothetical protein EOO28_24240 [Comamonadaceae bacterium]|nr:MAG: hypothetical protein EOO28_24240 [Comamonadaceae bacterium]